MTQLTTSERRLNCKATDLETLQLPNCHPKTPAGTSFPWDNSIMPASKVRLLYYGGLMPGFGFESRGFGVSLSLRLKDPLGPVTRVKKKKKKKFRGAGCDLLALLLAAGHIPRGAHGQRERLQFPHSPLPPAPIRMSVRNPGYLSRANGA